MSHFREYGDDELGSFQDGHTRRRVAVNVVSGSREWHQTITSELRSHLVHKVLEAIFRISDLTVTQNKAVHELIVFARTIEDSVFKIAQSRSEYYHVLAERIYRIQDDIRE